MTVDWPARGSRSGFADDGSTCRRGLCQSRLIVARSSQAPQALPGGNAGPCWHDGGVRHFDLGIIGTGSGNSIIDDRFDQLSVALVEMGTFGGTCLNVGCIPSKMFVHPADLADGARRAAAVDVRMHVDSVDWPGLRDRIFGRIDPTVAGGHRYRAGPECPNVTVYSAYV